MIIADNRALADWPQIFVDTKMTAMLRPLTHRCDIIETGKKSRRGWRRKRGRAGQRSG